jgi:hypothetical protein
VRDAVGDGSGTATASSCDAPVGLFDDSSGTEVSLDGAQPWIQFRFTGGMKRHVRFYTLTARATRAETRAAGS